MRLGLHHVTVNDVTPLELVDMAAMLGCAEVCLFTHIPRHLPQTLFPLVDRTILPDLKAALRHHAVRVANIEFFPISPDAPIDDYADALALGGELGARGAVVHIHDPDEARAVDTLGRLSDLAAKNGLRIGLEFMGLTPTCASIGHAARYVEQVGRPNIGIGMDPLHLIRTGGTADDVRAVPASAFTYAQICDGRGLHRSDNYLPEALDRLMPDDGDFPLADIMAALPVDIAIDVEVPSASRIAAGRPALPHAREAIDRARALLDLSRRQPPRSSPR